MIVRKILLAAGVAALMTTPAWALPSQTPSNDGTGHAPSTTPAGPPATTPNNTSNPGSANRASGHSSSHHSNSGQGNGQSGKPDHPSGSHKCKPHKVAYIAYGLLVSQTLVEDGSSTPTATVSSTLHENADSTYSGDITVDVKRTNHHAAADKGKTVTYTVSHVRVRFGLADINDDGSAGLDDVQPGARVKLIGKITKLAKKCDQSGFTAETTIRQVVFHAPPQSAS